jgi:hypothetical protein
MYNRDIGFNHDTELYEAPDHVWDSLNKSHPKIKLTLCLSWRRLAIFFTMSKPTVESRRHYSTPTDQNVGEWHGGW